MHPGAVEETLSACATFGDRLWSGDGSSASAGIIGRIVHGDNGNAGSRHGLLAVRAVPCFGLIGKGLHSEYPAREYEGFAETDPVQVSSVALRDVEIDELTSHRARMKIDGIEDILLKAIQWPN